MGINSESKNVKLFVNGVPVPTVSELSELQELQDSEMISEVESPFDLEVNLTLKIQIPKHWRCKTRKRFVKLLMSRGMSRNVAQRLAHNLRGAMPYGALWLGYFAF